jgi:hypothetical protein
MRRGVLLAAVAVAVAFSTTTSLHAEDSGQVPYAVMHKAISRAQQVKNPKVRAVVTLQSKAKTAKSPTMVIQAKSGPINVAIADDGEIRNFPISDELLKENPPVVSNQPKGTSQLAVGMEAVLPETLTHSGRELAQIVDTANAEIKKQAGMLSMMAPRAKALSFQFRGGGKQTVTINRAQPQVLSADANGTVRVEIDKSFAAQDPQVVLSEKPAKIMVN